MMRQVEICCGSFDDAIQAYDGGAKRIELNSALYLGGLTPSVGSLRLVKKYTDLQVMVMIRNRGAGFCYQKEDFETMIMDAVVMLEEGADGIVFGFLDEENNIDIKKTMQFMQLAKTYGKAAVFHRAFDCVRQPYEAIEQLIDIGVHRLLTSGQQAKALDGRALLKDLQKRYGDKIELLAGSGLHAQNVQEFIKDTNIHQVHSSCKKWMKDPTTMSANVDFGYAAGEIHSCYEGVDRHLVADFIAKVQALKE